MKKIKKVHSIKVMIDPVGEFYSDFPLKNGNKIEFWFAGEPIAISMSDGILRVGVWEWYQKQQKKHENRK